MGTRAQGWLGKRISAWLTKERGPGCTTTLCDFERLRFEIRPGDVLLVEGRSRVSEVIKLITQSPWTHSALYAGRVHDIDDPIVRGAVLGAYQGDPNDQLVIEALLGEGTVVSPLAKYRDEHVRICRPEGLSPGDAQKVIGHAARKLGFDYDVRHLLDLARFLLPYNILPRRWRSSLFAHNAGQATRTVCSSMLAEAFSAVQFPILPIVQRLGDGRVRLYHRNFRLFTPRDFDYSPYFEIIKYPLLGLNELTAYRKLPWDETGRICNGEEDCFLPEVTATDDALPVTPSDGEACPEHEAPAQAVTEEAVVVPRTGAHSAFTTLLRPLGHLAVLNRKKQDE